MKKGAKKLNRIFEWRERIEVCDLCVNLKWLKDQKSMKLLL